MSQLKEITDLSNQIAQSSQLLASKVSEVTKTVTVPTHAAGIDPFVFGLTIFVLACFVGYFVVWKVTPALHTPLMAVTNAISGVIVVGAIIALGTTEGFSMIAVVSFVAIVIASINIFGGFLVTWRMLQMFKK